MMPTCLYICCMVVQKFFVPHFFGKALIAHLFILLCFISFMADRDMQALLSCYSLIGIFFLYSFIVMYVLRYLRYNF